VPAYGGQFEVGKVQAVGQIKIVDGADFHQSKIEASSITA
jgi:hypothetical protein